MPRRRVVTGMLLAAGSLAGSALYRRRAARHRELAVRMDGALEGRRRDEQRHRALRAQNRRRGRHPRDVDEHARAQDPALERGPILAQRPLVVRATRDVAERARVEPLLGRALVVPDVDEVVAQRADSAVSGT